MRVEKRGLLFKTLWKRHVVMIHDRKIFSPRHVEQPVSRTGNAEILLVHGVYDARIVIGLHHLFHAGIGGAVVQNKKLEVRERL